MEVGVEGVCLCPHLLELHVQGVENGGEQARDNDGQDDGKDEAGEDENPAGKDEPKGVLVDAFHISVTIDVEFLLKHGEKGLESEVSHDTGEPQQDVREEGCETFSEGSDGVQ